jgi:hypothetical protein
MTKYRRVSLVCGIVGCYCLAVYEFIGSHVGADGHLHEFFALQASGMLLLLGALLTETASWWWRLWRRGRSRS